MDYRFVWPESGLMAMPLAAYAYVWLRVCVKLDPTRSPEMNVTECRDLAGATVGLAPLGWMVACAVFIMRGSRADTLWAQWLGMEVLADRVKFAAVWAAPPLAVMVAMAGGLALALRHPALRGIPRDRLPSVGASAAMSFQVCGWFGLLSGAAVYSEERFGTLLPFYFVLSAVALFFPVLYGAWLRARGRVEPIREGPVHKAFSELAKKAGVTCDRLWKLKDGGGVANALAAGALPQLRSVYLTETLMQALPPAELRAVMAHEIAHIRQGHLAILAAVSYGWLAVCWLLSDAGFGGIINGLYFLYWIFIFNRLSRRLEYSADAYAASLTSPRDMIRALEATARTNLTPVEQTRSEEAVQRHPSLRRRIERLERMEAAEEARRAALPE